MIISVHIPRTAGSSFRAYLRSNPNIKLKEDYGNPIMVPGVIRNGFALGGRMIQAIRPLSNTVDCLHGHFLPFKYKSYTGKPGVKFITWLRDPAERIRSQYDYCFQSDKAVDKSPFQNKVAREKWSFEAFIEHPRMNNLYTKFFWQFPIDRFDCIGLVEHYEEDFKYICEQFFNDMEPKFTYGNRTRSVSLDESMRNHIKKLNEADFLVYQQALELRNSRVKLSAQD